VAPYSSTIIGSERKQVKCPQSLVLPT
jgi:hypothetical protein